MAMRDFKRQRGRQAQYLRVAIGCSIMVLLALVAFGTAHGAWDMYGKFNEAASDDGDAQQQLAQLQTQYESVSQTVKALDTSRGMDAAVRERYGVGLPGEGEIDVIRQASTTEASSTPQGFFNRLWDALFGWL
jgi:hypothetical protein